MQITTTIQQKKNIEIEVPCFYAEITDYGVTKALAVLDEKNVITVFETEKRTFVSNDDVDKVESEIITAMETFECISEERFFQIHAEAMKKLSFTPVLNSEIKTR